MWVQLGFCRSKPLTLIYNVISVLDQINERAEWLAEMEALGQGKKYRPEIHDQISERLHRIRSLETKIKMKADGGYRFVD